MALANYNDLQSAIVDFAPEISDADPIKTFIELAEVEFFPLLKHFLGEKTTTIVTATNSITVPSDCNELRRIRIDGVNAIPASAYGATLNVGETGYLRSGNTISFAPTKTGNRSVEITYFSSPAPLSASATTNWLLTKFPQVYLWGALAQGYAWRGNGEQEAIAKSKRDEALALVAENHRRSTNSGNQWVMIEGGFSYGD